MLSTALNCKEHFERERKDLYVGYSSKQWNAKLCVMVRDPRQMTVILDLEGPTEEGECGWLLRWMELGWRVEA